jgi:hypothetical protein
MKSHARHGKGATVDQGDAVEKKHPDFSDDDNQLDDGPSHARGGHQHPVNLNDDLHIDDKSGVGVTIIGSKPVVVALETNIDQNEDVNQNADVDVDKSGHGGHKYGVYVEQIAAIDQRIDVDVDISEDHGVIHIEIGVDLDTDIDVDSDADISVDHGGRNHIGTGIGQISPAGQGANVHVNVEAGVDANVDVDVTQLALSAVRAAIGVAEGHDGGAINVDLGEEVASDLGVQIVVDVGDHIV